MLINLYNTFSNSRFYSLSKLQNHSCLRQNAHKLSNRTTAKILGSVHRSIIAKRARNIDIHGSTQSFAQIFGRRTRPKSYSGKNLILFIRILQSFPRMRGRAMRRMMVMATRRIFESWTIQRMLEHVLHLYKKCTIRAMEADPVLVGLYYLGLRRRGIPRERLKFVDEVHVSTKNGVQTKGYSPVGVRCVVEDSFVRKQRTTCCGLVGINGMECHVMKPNSFSKMDFRVFMILVALRGGHLKPGDYVVIDNARIHIDEKYMDLLRMNRISVKKLPPYWPQGNVIELVWRGAKQHMLTMKGLSSVDPVASMNIALQLYYNRDLRSLYSQCGYS